MRPMNFGKVFVPLAGLLLLGLAYRAYGWPGVAFAGGAIVMFLLMHFNRTMQVLKRAADRPIGTVPSAVMLNAKLKPKLTLLHVIAMTRALGEQRTPKDAQPEIYRWTDNGGSWVDATFVDGKLTEWTLVRPQAPDEDAAQAADAPSADAVKPGAADALRPPV
ncbi:MAG TPA: glycerate kinase [Variovorax sp.]|jgi:putative intracellular protease/amidase|nr:glycerate kinase [Variovorax sp.]